METVLLASRNEEKKSSALSGSVQKLKTRSRQVPKADEKEKKAQQVLTAHSFLTFIVLHLRALRLFTGSPSSPLHISFHFSATFHSETQLISLTPPNFSQGHMFQCLPTTYQTATKECESETSKAPFLCCFGRRIKFLRKICDFYLILGFTIFKPR